ALVLHVEVAVAERVPHAIHYTSGPEGDPEHLHAPHERADVEAEEVDVDPQHDDDPEPGEAAEHVALEPVVGCPLSVLLEDAGLLHRSTIIEGTLQDDLAEPFDERAVRVALPVGEGVVL